MSSVRSCLDQDTFIRIEERPSIMEGVPTMQ